MAETRDEYKRTDHLRILCCDACGKCRSKGTANQIKALLTFGPDCSYNLICEIFYRKSGLTPTVSMGVIGAAALIVG